MDARDAVEQQGALPARAATGAAMTRGHHIQREIYDVRTVGFWLALSVGTISWMIFLALVLRWVWP
jgi:hypothetical protein